MKIKKNNGYIDILELVDENDKVIHALKIRLDYDRVLRGVNKANKDFAEAEKAYNRENSDANLDALYEKALETFSLFLGDENAKVIAEWYGDEKLSMINEICPYVAMKIYPAFTAEAKTRAKQYKALRRKIRR